MKNYKIKKEYLENIPGPMSGIKNNDEIEVIELEDLELW